MLYPTLAMYHACMIHCLCGGSARGSVSNDNQHHLVPVPCRNGTWPVWDSMVLMLLGVFLVLGYVRSWRILFHVPSPEGYYQWRSLLSSILYGSPAIICAIVAEIVQKPRMTLFAALLCVFVTRCYFLITFTSMCLMCI